MSRISWFTVIFIVIMAVGALVMQQEFRAAQDRPAMQRELSQLRLSQFATAIAHYRERHGTWPGNLFQIMQEGKLSLSAHAVRGCGLYRYRPPPSNAGDDYVIMASDGFHAGTSAGKPWGGQGEVASKDIPPLAYVLTAGGQIEALSPAERDRRWPPVPAL